MEERFYLLGFVPIDILKTRRDIWFAKLDSKQISLVSEYLNNNLLA